MTRGGGDPSTCCTHAVTHRGGRGGDVRVVLVHGVGDVEVVPDGRQPRPMGRGQREAGKSKVQALGAGRRGLG